MTLKLLLRATKRDIFSPSLFLIGLFGLLPRAGLLFGRNPADAAGYSDTHFTRCND